MNHPQPHINHLRAELMATLRDLRSRTAPMEPDRARAVAQVASVLVDSARVEVEFLRATGNDISPFIDALKAPADIPAVEDGITTSKATRGTIDRTKPGRLIHRNTDDDGDVAGAAS